MQRFLAAANWDAGGVRDDLRDYVVEHLGDRGTVLVAGETSDLKKATRTAGVQRQYSGTAGRIENCQVAVFLTYAAPAGHALIDRALYLPKSWTAGAGRCQAAGIPEDTFFATKPKLARQMIGRAIDAGVPAAWAADDEVYGADPGLRKDLKTRQIGYVLAIARTHLVATGAGPAPAAQIAARLPRTAWQRHCAGPGSTLSWAKLVHTYSPSWLTAPGAVATLRVAADRARPGQGVPALLSHDGHDASA